MPTMYVLRGIPGSGKSTIAKLLTEMEPATENFQCAEDWNDCPLYAYWSQFEVGFTIDSIIHSTDDLFMVDGEYKFDLNKLGRNHAQNKVNAEESCKKKIPAVIIDNTNLTWKEVKPYVDIAKKYGYDISIVNVYFNPRTPEVYAERNAHGVDLETIERMVKKYEPGFFEDKIKGKE